MTDWAAQSVIFYPNTAQKLPKQLLQKKHLLVKVNKIEHFLVDKILTTAL